MIEAIAQLHATLGIALFGLLSVLTLVAIGVVVGGRGAEALALARRVALGLVAAQAAIGLAVAVRGRGPAEGIHWLYGVAIILALLAPSSLEPSSERGRTAVLVGSTLLAAVFAWRLWGSG